MAWRVHNAPALRRVAGARVWVPALMVLTAVALLVWPAGLTIGALDLAPLAWLLIFLAAILLPPPSPVVQGTLIWLAVTFVGVQFPAGRPQDAHLRHLPALEPARRRRGGRALERLETGAMALGRYRAGSGCCRVLVPVPVRYLPAARWRAQPGSACARARVGVGAGTLRQRRPHRPPGFSAWCTAQGWKGIGALYAEGKLAGDFDSNEKPELTAWYVPNAFRLSRKDPDPCGSKPRYYFVADDLVDYDGRAIS